MADKFETALLTALREFVANAVKTGKPAKAAPEAEAEEPEQDDGLGDLGGGDESDVTRENVRDSLKALAKAAGGDRKVALKVLRDVGGSKGLEDLDEDKFGDVIAAADKAAAKLKKK